MRERGVQDHVGVDGERGVEVLLERVQAHDRVVEVRARVQIGAEARDKLNEAWQGASEQLYKAAAEKAQAAKTAGTATAGAGEAKSEKDQGPVIDAEVVDEKKK